MDGAVKPRIILLGEELDCPFPFPLRNQHTSTIQKALFGCVSTCLSDNFLLLHYGIFCVCIPKVSKVH